MNKDRANNEQGELEASGRYQENSAEVTLRRACDTAFSAEQLAHWHDMLTTHWRRYTLAGEETTYHESHLLKRFEGKPLTAEGYAWHHLLAVAGDLLRKIGLGPDDQISEILRLYEFREVGLEIELPADGVTTANAGFSYRWACNGMIQLTGTVVGPTRSWKLLMPFVSHPFFQYRVFEVDGTTPRKKKPSRRPWTDNG